MGTVEQRGKKHRAKVRKDGVKASETFDSKAAAWAWVHETERKIAAGQHHVYDKRTLADLLEKFAEERERDWDKTRLAWFMAQPIAATKLHELTPKKLDDWKKARLKEVSGETVRRDLALLSTALHHGVDILQWLASSPLTKVKRPKPGDARERITNDAEMKTIFYVAGYEPGTPPATKTARVAAAFAFAVETALAPAEICALRSDWVAGDVLTCPAFKTRPRRAVPLSQRAKQILEEVGFDFQLTPGSIDGLWREKIRKRALAEDLNFYDARATALTRLSKTYTVLELAKIAGHKDMNRLLVYYRESADELAKRINQPAA